MHLFYKYMAFIFLSESIKCIPLNNSDVAELPRSAILLNNSEDVKMSTMNQTQTKAVPYRSSVYRDANGHLQMRDRDFNRIAPITPLKKESSIESRIQTTLNEADNDNYPFDTIAQLDLSAFSSFFDKDKIIIQQDEEASRNNGPVLNRVALRIDGVGSQIEERLCNFHKLNHQPRKGSNMNGINLTIINQRNTTQTFSYELCGEPSRNLQTEYDAQKPNEINQVCNYHDSFPGNIKRTECRQQYGYRKLLALDENEKVIVDDFQFPSHCECFLIKK